MQSGVLLTSCGPSTVIDNCDIFSNGMGGIEITKDSTPIIRGCSIYDCQCAGINVFEN